MKKVIMFIIHLGSIFYRKKINNTFFIVVFTFLLGNISVLAQQKDISGIYYIDKSAWWIEIKDSSFYYIESTANTPIYRTDTLAICKWEWTTHEFIKIKSASPLHTALSSMKVNYATKGSNCDSITVSFNLPNSGPLVIEINDDHFRNYSFKYTSKNTNIKLPGDTKYFIFDVSNAVTTQHKYGKNYGIISFSNVFDEINIKNGMNYIKIDIQAIDDAYFDRYFIVDEFVRVKNDCIYWHGDIFKKRE